MLFAFVPWMVSGPHGTTFRVVRGAHARFLPFLLIAAVALVHAHRYVGISVHVVLGRQNKMEGEHIYRSRKRTRNNERGWYHNCQRCNFVQKGMRSPNDPSRVTSRSTLPMNGRPNYRGGHVNTHFTGSRMG